jgi:hypothetical protein
MGAEELNTSDAFEWEEGLPRPQWDLVGAMVESGRDPNHWGTAWTAVAWQWLGKLGTAFGRDYHITESDHFLTLASQADGIGGPLLRFAERCRESLLSALPGVAAFPLAGKQVVLALRRDDYYRYISLYHPEGEHRTSPGIQIREGYSHVALHCRQLGRVEHTLAHELTHAALHHLSMPVWLEEGLAQMFAHNMTGSLLLVVDAEMAGRHKRYWGKHGLDTFWFGESFSRPGMVEELSYQLAEILVRLLVEESRPGWFGWGREAQRRFFTFLQQAGAADCGEAACREHLRFGLGDLAAKFLGPGAWSPGL